MLTSYYIRLQPHQPALLAYANASAAELPRQGEVIELYNASWSQTLRYEVVCVLRQFSVAPSPEGSLARYQLLGTGAQPGHASVYLRELA